MLQHELRQQMDQALTAQALTAQARDVLEQAHQRVFAIQNRMAAGLSPT